VPDYLIGIGPYTQRLERDLQENIPLPAGGALPRYELVAKIDLVWKDLYRPELFWRVFKPITGYNKDRDVVFIFKRSGARTP
jgi:hypothetical protein